MEGKTMDGQVTAKFNALLGKMLLGEAPSAKKKSSSDQSSGEALPDDCSETQTRPDTSKDASH